jgi:hypothetical protein
LILPPKLGRRLKHDGNENLIRRSARRRFRDRELIILTFRPLQNGLAVLIRGAHFRICADGTLRGPDNTIAARYLNGFWYLGRGRHASVECAGPVYLRVTNRRGQRECIGPFTSVRMADGAIFSTQSCLGAHMLRAESGTEPVDLWREVSLISTL